MSVCVCVSNLYELYSQKYIVSVQVVYNCRVYLYVNLYIYKVLFPCVCPVNMSKKGKWAFPVSGKEIWDFCLCFVQLYLTKGTPGPLC